VAATRIGIVGSDNSHALGFSTLLNVHRAFGDRARVTAICGDDPQQTEMVASAGGIGLIVPSPDEMATQVDAAIVVNRHASRHLANAEPFARVGLPILIDKPFAADADDAAAFLARARLHGSTVTSYSSLRWVREIEDLATAVRSIGTPVYGSFAGPCDFDSVYDGAFFYGVHTVEVAAAVMPGEPVRVRVTRVGISRTVVVEMADGSPAVLNLDPRLPDFHAHVFGTRHEVACRVPARPPDLVRCLEVFLNMVDSGVRPLSERHLLDPVATLSAIIESDRSDGIWVTVAKPSIQ
jgi:predicted dehydrogenase